MDKSDPSKRVSTRLISVVICMVLLIPTTALAYLDPTTGSMIISAIVGLFASLVLAIKTYWYRIKAFFKGKPTDTDDEVS